MCLAVMLQGCTYASTDKGETITERTDDIFDTSYVHQINIEISEEDWNDLLNNPLEKTKYKVNVTIDGKEYARFMFFNGICRSTNGPITYLNNPYIRENLAFSFQSQVIAESYFPGITRKIYLKAWRYNMHLVPRNMLIELGAQTNTVEEVMNTVEILAFILNEVLSGQ